MIVSTFLLGRPRHYLILLIGKNEAELEINAPANTVGWRGHEMTRDRLHAETKARSFLCLC
jgi:hypothetical protein